MKYAADYELWLRFAKHADLYATSTLLTGFTIRGNQNRSIKNADRYNKEVYACRDTTLEDPDVKREKVVRDLAMYRRARRVMGIKRLARGMISKKYQGPLLEWDFATSQYKLKWQEYFT